MTGTELDPVLVEREQVARNLILLGMLADQVGKSQAALRKQLQSGAVAGEKWAETVPDPDDADAKLDAGKVRFDPGDVTVRVVSETKFLDWVEACYPARLVRQEETDGRRAMTEREADAVMGALMLAEEHRTGFDPWQAVMFAFWEALQDAGFSLTPRVGQPATRIVRPEWQAELVKSLKDNARKVAEPGDVTPVDANGVTVEGVTVTVGPPQLVVTPSKDKDIQDAYVRRQLGSTFELLPAEPTRSEDR